MLPSIGDCAGSEGAALFGCALISSYLFLFIGSVYINQHLPSTIESCLVTDAFLSSPSPDSTEPPTRPLTSTPTETETAPSEVAKDPRSSARPRTGPPSSPRSKPTRLDQPRPAVFLPFPLLSSSLSSPPFLCAAPAPTYLPRALVLGHLPTARTRLLYPADSAIPPPTTTSATPLLSPLLHTSPSPPTTPKTYIALPT